ncbi:somatostatin receptor type 4-like [Clavelina lepadiformis]|uniref:G-protein coupled receptors family 1 profile domain-containing protein n=1 Tax=Clavelina lepadiformis TaxID=159417 RepID=A0ABP0FJZ2_CLALP
MVDPTAPAGVLLYIIMVVGLVGNSIVLFVLIRLNKNWCTSTIYLLNLAISDALYLIATPFVAHTFLNQHGWIFGPSMCAFIYYWIFFAMYAGVFFVTGMAIDRWMAVVHPINLACYRTCKKAMIVCVGIWISAALFALPQAFYFRIIPDFHHNQTSNDTVVVICDYHVPESNPNRLHILSAVNFIPFLIGFLLPVTIIGFIYYKIVTSVKRNLISRHVSENKVTTLASFIVIAFFVCWLPAQSVHLGSAILHWSDNDSNVIEIFRIFFPYAFCLAWSHSCFNPLAYAFLTTKFKERTKVVFARRKSSDLTMRITPINDVNS